MRNIYLKMHQNAFNSWALPPPVKETYSAPHAGINGRHKKALSWTGEGQER